MNEKAGRYKSRGKGGAKKAPAAKPDFRSGTIGKWYAAEDVPRPLNRNFTPKPAKLRSSITPGTVLIILSGRFRARRVVFLKQLESGLLLVSGPFKVNGVPLRRVNQAYVIATSTTVDVSGVDVADINDRFFARVPVAKSTDEEGAFFEGAAKPVELSAERKSAQKKVDTALLRSIDKTMKAYLGARFTLSKGQAPHELSF